MASEAPAIQASGVIITCITMSTGINGLTLYIKLFQWCGFTSGYQHHRHRPIILRILIESWPILMVVITSSIELWLAYTYRDITFHPTTTIGYLTDVIQVILPIFCVLTIAVENLLYGRRMDKILWEIMNQIDHRKVIIRKAIVQTNYNSNENSDGHLTYEQLFHWKFLLVNGIGIGTDTMIISIIIKREPEWARCIIYCLWSSTICRLAMLQTILYLEWIVHRFGTIEKCIIELSAHNNDMYQQQFVLKQIQLMYSDLWSFTCKINRRFDLTMFSLIINYFICITIDLYWVITRIAFNKVTSIVRKCHYINNCLPLFFYIFFIVHPQSVNCNDHTTTRNISCSHRLLR